MKFIINFFDKLQNRPSYKFAINIFLLKMNTYFSLKQTLYIHIFLHIKKMLQVKLFKFNYIIYNNFILYFIIINLANQVLLYVIIKWYL